MYELIEARSLGPYIELFARHTRPGWDSWGDEIEGE
jgi:N6-adenosine-specific RNA methylase IME4